MGKIEEAVAQLGADLQRGAEQWRDEFRAGMASFDRAQRLQGCRVLPLRGQLLYGAPGRLLGWSLRSDQPVTLTLRNGRDDTADPLATVIIPAGQSSNLTVPGASITEALWLQTEWAGTAGTVVGGIYVGAVD